MRLTLRSILSVAAALAPATVQAQSVSILEPESFVHAPGDSLELSLLRETGGERERAAWPTTSERAWLFVRADGTQENLAEVPRLGEDEDRTRLVLPHVDANLIGLDLAPRVEVVPRAAWRRFLEERVGAAPATLLPETRVRRVESMKLLVRVVEPGDEVTPSATAQSKSGQTLELRPLADPTCVPEGGDLPFRVYVPDGEAAGLRLVARHLSSGAVWTSVVRAGGIGDVRITAPGRWTVEVHQLVESTRDSAADVELRSATIAFEAPAAGDEGGGR